MALSTLTVVKDICAIMEEHEDDSVQRIKQYIVDYTSSTSKAHYTPVAMEYLVFSHMRRWKSQFITQYFPGGLITNPMVQYLCMKTKFNTNLFGADERVYVALVAYPGLPCTIFMCVATHYTNKLVINQHTRYFGANPQLGRWNCTIISQLVDVRCPIVNPYNGKWHSQNEWVTTENTSTVNKSQSPDDTTEISVPKLT